MSVSMRYNNDLDETDVHTSILFHWLEGDLYFILTVSQ